MQALSLVGFSAEALAVAGVSDDELQQARGFFAAQSAEFATVQRLRQDLTKKIAARVTTEANAPSVSEIQSELSARVGSLRSAFLELFGENTQLLLRRWIEAAKYDVDPEFRVLALQPEEWKQLETNLGALRAAARSGEQASPATQTAVNEFRSRVEVIEATSLLGSRTNTIRQGLRSQE
ncbi:MAG: hypothetical protein ACREJD_17765 [Phycisphaerales bacterium]